MLRCFYLYVFFSSWKTTIILESFDKFLCILETRWNTPYWILLENHHNWILNTFFTLFSVTFLTRPFLYWIDSLKLLNLKFLPQGVQGPWFFIQPLFLLDQHLQKWYDQLIMEKNALLSSEFEREIEKYFQVRVPHLTHFWKFNFLKLKGRRGWDLSHKIVENTH